LTLYRNLNHGVVDTVLVTVAHYKCPVERVYTGVEYVKLKDNRASHRNQLGRRIQTFRFSTYYETGKFTRDQSD